MSCSYRLALAKPGCVISDCNPELINMYREVADSCEKVIAHLKHYSNDKDCYYHVRSQKWHDLSPTEAAARTIYLNRTCFNGLYRVNKSGDFNVPFGGYKKPNFCDEENLRKASKLLSQTEISCCDFEKLLLEVAQPGDCVFLDPPYFPVSDYADFKRYTKEQFSEEDQIRVATTASVVASRGCHVLATNANHPKVLSLYDDFSIRVVPTKRNISSKASTRTGEDVIIRSKSLFHENALSESVALYPATRYMGSKSKILDELWSILSQFDFDSALDLFSGSGIVGYMFKSQGKRVICNDYMKMSYMFAKALVENPGVTLTADKVLPLLVRSDHCSTFVQDTFAGLYYSDEDNAFIDTVRSNIPALNDEYEQAIAMASLIRACMKKRPRGIFTYVGDRYDDGRADLRKTLEQQFLDAVESFNDAVMLGGPECKALNINSMDVGVDADLVYLDPPYYSRHSDNEYVRRYHFVEGLARSWEGVEMQENTKTKKFKSYPTPFSSYEGSVAAFKELFSRYQDKIIAVSYSSNSLPRKEELFEMLHAVKKNVEVYPINHRYSFGTQKNVKRNVVKEYLFVGW